MSDNHVKFGDSRLPLRFWTKVQPVDSGCWLWTAATTEGYGVVLRELGGRSLAKAHRLAYEALIGPIPVGLQVDHLCRVRNCVNPNHVEPVTRRENILRGTSPSALHAKKTSCPQGHAYDRVITRYRTGSPTTERRCSICENAKARRLYERKRVMP